MTRDGTRDTNLPLFGCFLMDMPLASSLPFIDTHTCQNTCLVVEKESVDTKLRECGESGESWKLPRGNCQVD